MRMLRLGLVSVGVVMTIGFLLASGAGVSQAGHDTTHGDLLLDNGSIPAPVAPALSSNTATSVGTIERQLCNVTAGDTVTIDVVAVNANDWAGMDFVLYYPSPAVVTAPGPTSTAEGGAFDFVPLDVTKFADTFGPQNFLFPDSSDAAADYATTDGVSDGSSPHGVSMFDSLLAGNGNGGINDGGLARITLDTTGLAAGEYTLILGVTAVFAGGLHSPPTLGDPLPPFLPDNFGAFKLAIDVPCSTDSDGDGVSDADENAFGSDPNDVDSIPENDDWIPEFFGQPQTDPGETPGGPTCSDGIDNDGDGEIDQADSGCAAFPPHDSRLVKISLPASSIPVGEVVTKPVEVKVQNQSNHTDSMLLRVRVTNADTDKCTVNESSGAQVEVLNTVVTLDAGHKATFSGPQLKIDFFCSELPAGGAPFAVKADVDHNADDPFQLDDEDSDPADNSRFKPLFVK